MTQETPKTVQCYRCTMTFDVAKPVGVSYEKGKAGMACERSRCADCKRLFWHAEQITQRVRVGILPEWLPEWQA